MGTIGVSDPTPAATARSCGDCCTRLVDFGVSVHGRTILENINLHMHCGELTSVIGPNGGGKTTLLRAMIGELPHSGTLRFVHQGRVESAKPLRIGYVPQRFDIDSTAPTTVLDLFASALNRSPLWIGTGRARREDTRARLALVGADGLLERKLAELSAGQLQRVLLALALSPVPELLLLDEPVSALDPAGTRLFYETVSRLRTDYDLSILLVSHDLAAAARVADRMLLINRTIHRDGSPDAVLQDPLVKETFGFRPRPEDFAGDRTTGRVQTHEQCDLPSETLS